jgi:hypothetical protein
MAFCCQSPGDCRGGEDIEAKGQKIGDLGMITLLVAFFVGFVFSAAVFVGLGYIAFRYREAILRPIAVALMGPTTALTNLQLEVIGHLYDRGAIDPQAIVALLQKRLDEISTTPGPEAEFLRTSLVTQIAWLDRIGTGLKSGEKKL